MNTQVKIIYTGGTLGMQAGKQGLEPAPELEKRVQSALESAPEASSQLDQTNWTVIERQPLLDSANITPADWESIATTCRDHADAQGIVIVHGTDTLAYTACALAFLLREIQIPVILTGSQKPLEAKDSDALGNLVGATHAVTSAPSGVWVYFHHRLMPATRVVKKDALGFDGFATPRLAMPTESSSIGLSLQATPRPWDTIRIPMVHLTPGFHAEHLTTLLTSQPNAIILALYGLGTLADQNTALLDALTLAQQKSIILVAISQCFIGKIDFTLYAAGAELTNRGVISGQDMTLEAAYTKLMILFRLGYATEQIKHLFTRSIAGELTSTHE